MANAAECTALFEVVCLPDPVPRDHHKTGGPRSGNRAEAPLLAAHVSYAGPCEPTCRLSQVAVLRPGAIALVKGEVGFRDPREIRILR